jgi:hypothetical protein
MILTPPPIVLVRLRPHEVTLGTYVGNARQDAALAARCLNAHGRTNGDPDADRRDHIAGALAELATAKQLGFYWSGHIAVWNEPDLLRYGQGIETRWTRMEPPKLVIRDGDPAERLYVLASGDAPEIWLHGWIIGRDGRRPQWRHGYGGRPPAFFVPTTDLQPFEMLWSRTAWGGGHA